MGLSFAYQIRRRGLLLNWALLTISEDRLTSMGFENEPSISAFTLGFAYHAASERPVFQSI